LANEKSAHKLAGIFLDVVGVSIGKDENVDRNADACFDPAGLLRPQPLTDARTGSLAQFVPGFTAGIPLLVRLGSYQ